MLPHTVLFLAYRAVVVVLTNGDNGRQLRAALVEELYARAETEARP